MGFWVRFLLVVVAATGAFGLSMVIAPGPIQDYFNWMIFGEAETPTGFSAEAVDYVSFVYGVLGAVMLGWMLLVGWIVAGPLARGEDWATTALSVSVGAWFVVDTAHSLATGYPENAVFNVIFLAALAVPFLMALRARRARAA